MTHLPQPDMDLINQTRDFPIGFHELPVYVVKARQVASPVLNVR